MICCVIPTYNERHNIAPLLATLRAAVPGVQVLFVDDNSPDGTAEEIVAAGEGVALLQRPAKLGIASAYQDGLAYLREKIRSGEMACEAIVTMDADLSHEPSVINQFVNTLSEADLVIGSRYVAKGGTEGWEAWRHLLSAGANWYARRVLQTPIHDLTSGFMGFRPSLLSRLPVGGISFKGYAYQIAFKMAALSAGATFREVPIIFRGREEGKSKLDLGIIWEGVKAPWILRKKHKDFYGYE